MIDVQVNRAQLRAAIRLLDDVPKGFPRAASAALNRSVISARSHLVRRLKAVLNMKSGDIRKSTKIRKSNYTRLVAEVNLTGRRIPVYRFGPRPRTPEADRARKRGRGVSWKIRRQGGRTKARHAFVARTASGHVGVYQRVGRARLPIRELLGPSLPQVLDDDARMVRETMEDAGQLLEKNLASQVERLLARRR